jgi:hypothetical protein
MKIIIRVFKEKGRYHNDTALESLLQSVGESNPRYQDENLAS